MLNKNHVMRSRRLLGNNLSKSINIWFKICHQVDYSLDFVTTQKYKRLNMISNNDRESTAKCVRDIYVTSIHVLRLNFLASDLVTIFTTLYLPLSGDTDAWKISCQPTCFPRLNKYISIALKHRSIITRLGSQISLMFEGPKKLLPVQTTWDGKLVNETFGASQHKSKWPPGVI